MVIGLLRENKNRTPIRTQLKRFPKFNADHCSRRSQKPFYKSCETTYEFSRFFRIHLEPNDKSAATNPHFGQKLTNCHNLNSERLSLKMNMSFEENGYLK